MSGTALPNPYAFPPRYTQALLKKKEKDPEPTNYEDWRKWNLARDGAQPRLSDGKNKAFRRPMAGAAVEGAGVKTSLKKMSMAEVEGRLFTQAAEYAAPPVRPGAVGQEEVEGEVEEQEHEEEAEGGTDEEEGEEEEGEEEEGEEEGEEEEEEEEEEEVTAQLRRESEELAAELEDLIEDQGTDIIEEEAVVHRGSSRERKRKRRVAIDPVPEDIEIDNTESAPRPLEGSPELEYEDILDYSVDYRENFEQPVGPYEKAYYPARLRPETDVQKQEEVVREWEALVEKRKALEPYDVTLVKHTEDRLQAHRAELDRLVAVEPFLVPYTTTRIAILKDCLERYENADEIVNVKAVIKAYENKVLGNFEDVWTVYYNGKIVDRLVSYHELLWSVRQPLYKKIYGATGSIWIEPPTNDLGKACVMVDTPGMVSGGHWYVQQNLCFPWYDSRYALEWKFLLDTGCTDPLVTDKDLLDLGLIKRDCPHVTNRTVSTASEKICVDFYPCFIQHLDPDPRRFDNKGNKEPLYPFMDTIVGTTKESERLSGLDLYRFCYVASEPSTGRYSYHPRHKKLEIRRNIAAGGTMTPRAWFTRTWDHRTQRFQISSKIVSLVNRPPRLLNPNGDRWVETTRTYPYQWGRIDRSPYRVGYIPGHKVHPPTPDDIRDDRKYYWSRGLAYRDDRPAVNPTRHTRDQYYQLKTQNNKQYQVPTPRPLNPWQYTTAESYTKEAKMPRSLTNIPRNPLGVMYWDRNFPAAANQNNLGVDIMPDKIGMRYRHRKDNDYWPMRQTHQATHRAMGAVSQEGGTELQSKLKRPRYFDEERVQPEPEDMEDEQKA